MDSSRCEVEKPAIVHPALAYPGCTGADPGGGAGPPYDGYDPPEVNVVYPEPGGGGAWP